MVKLALLSWLAVAAPIFSALADALSSLETRACTTPANTLKNPSFESGALSPWIFKPTYVKLGSATVVKSGYKSDHAIQAAGTAGYKQQSYNKLSQTFKICKASRFQLSWSMLVPKDSVKYTAPGKPGLFVEAKAPDGLPYSMGYFTFDTKTFSSNIYTPRFKGTHKVDQWANFVADFPNSQTGTWTISMEWMLDFSLLDRLVKRFIGSDEFYGLHDPQAIIAKGRELDRKYGYIYGNSYEKEARKRAAELSPGYRNSDGGGGTGWSSHARKGKL
ncbi:hypothetical protein FGADI_2042 [Fusarium gaditjirri]|uniref:Uncharacterized protein n=1 Tax=Fusarium gaditjirri TaxID=282569 RepID=A0A8H4TJ36_9HYPO|nr:hypothetical protein FGADI_2042 [Fusarium gaditjirri]